MGTPTAIEWRKRSQNQRPQRQPVVSAFRIRFRKTTDRQINF